MGLDSKMQRSPDKHNGHPADWWQERKSGERRGRQRTEKIDEKLEKEAIKERSSYYQNKMEIVNVKHARGRVKEEEKVKEQSKMRKIETGSKKRRKKEVREEMK